MSAGHTTAPRTPDDHAVVASATLCLSLSLFLRLISEASDSPGHRCAGEGWDMSVPRQGLEGTHLCPPLHSLWPSQLQLSPLEPFAQAQEVPSFWCSFPNEGHPSQSRGWATREGGGRRAQQGRVGSLQGPLTPRLKEPGVRDTDPWTRPKASVPTTPKSQPLHGGPQGRDATLQRMRHVCIVYFQVGGQKPGADLKQRYKIIQVSFKTPQQALFLGAQGKQGA